MAFSRRFLTRISNNINETKQHEIRLLSPVNKDVARHVPEEAEQRYVFQRFLCDTNGARWQKLHRQIYIHHWCYFVKIKSNQIKSTSFRPYSQIFKKSCHKSPLPAPPLPLILLLLRCSKVACRSAEHSNTNEHRYAPLRKMRGPKTFGDWQ